MELTPAQRAALDHVSTCAAGPYADLAVPTLTALVAAHARVTLNFHPDRLLADGRTVARSLAADGVYRGQFETGISNGSRSAFVGGGRYIWEHRLFGGAYDHAPVSQRPRYGALNLHAYTDGASPRFGSCYLRLRPEVNRRCTFTLGDSHLGPSAVGTVDALGAVLAGLVELARATGITLGTAGVDPVELLTGLPERAYEVRPDIAPGRCLDDYIEAQVHGEVLLARDAEALVLDPSLRAGEVGATLVDLAAVHGIAVEWHCGFELAPDEFDDEFRGPHMPALAQAVARWHAGERGVIDAAVVGRAAASTVRDPGRWSRFGSPDEMPQYVKHLWHTLVHCGRPARAGEDPPDTGAPAAVRPAPASPI
ncbi:MAG: DUF3626 domain-containing protein [Betaproteobacteria bacterium]